MKRFQPSRFALSFLLTAGACFAQTTQPAQVGLAASRFATSPTGAINNIELMWAASTQIDRYDVLRAKDQAGPFEKIYSGKTSSFNDYSLTVGTHFYQVIGYKGDDKLESNIASAESINAVEGLSIFTNQESGKGRLPEQPLKVGDTFYRFQITREAGAFNRMTMYTSADQKNWSEGTVVMDKTSHPDFDDCKFESEHTFYDKKHDQFLFFGHWERSKGYKDGKVAIAVAKPGEKFTVKHVYQPLGVEVRDMSQFIDDDGTGYLVAAANQPGKGANATLHIFKLNETNDDAVEITARVIENGFREAPHIVKKDGFYYLVFSQAAGWYPSQGGYVSSHAMAGPWSAPRKIGNSSTFGSQSGAVVKFGSSDPQSYVMRSNRWMFRDLNPGMIGEAMPMFFANGFAFYDYSPQLLYDASKSLVVPLQMGELLSQNALAESSLPAKEDHEAAKAFDGSYETSFQSDTKKWPFTITSDLGGPCDVRNMQISWMIAKGSEAFYTYTIEGSTDGKEWKTLVDRSDKTDKVISKTYGFTSEVLPEKSLARYVRLNVINAHLQNNPNNNWYAPTIYEIKIFGDRLKK